jgi:ADP-heptose:LPS heptosyltransferase
MDAGECVRKLRQEMERIPRFLIIRIRSLGDSILALPLLDALHAWRPDLQIDVLVEASFAPVFFRQPAVHETLAIKEQHWPGAAAWSRLQTCLELRRRRYSAVLNLHGGSTSLLFTLATGSRMRIGQEKYRQAWTYHALIPSPFAVWQRQDLHTVEDQLTLLRWLEIPIPERLAARLYLDDSARGRVSKRLHIAGIGDSPYLVIHATATLPSKQWAERNFAELGDRLLERHGIPVVFTTGPRESQVLLDIGRHAKRSHFFWADLELEDLFALIEGCRLFIGNDSGPTHAAAALLKPVVVVWGSSDFRVWHPWETEYQAVRLDLPCMPCPGYACAAYGSPKCILDVRVDAVFDAVQSMLQTNRED